MNRICFSFLLASFCLVSSCRYFTVPVATDSERRLMLGQRNLPKGVELNFRKLPSIQLKGKARVDGRTLTYYVVNSSNDDLVLLSGDGGYQYVLLYIDRNNQLKESVFTWSYAWSFSFSKLEILERLQSSELAIHPWNATRYEIGIPEDCVKIVGLWLGIESITFSELRECENAADLERRLDKGMRYVVVEWWN